MDNIRKKINRGGTTTCSDVCKQETIDGNGNHPQCVAAYTKGNHKSKAKPAQKGIHIAAQESNMSTSCWWEGSCKAASTDYSDIHPSKMRRMDCCTIPSDEHNRHTGNNNTEDADHQTQICYCGNPDINYRLDRNHPRFNDKYKECATNPTKEEGDPMQKYIKT